MADPRVRRPAPGRTVERYNRRTRWFHAGVYLSVLVLLGTGGWLLLGREGRPSPLARVSRMSDTLLHTRTGWVLVALLAAGLVLGARAAGTFVAESFRIRPGEDRRWFARWPRAVFTGRFAAHGGHFDPGQRLLNIAMTLTLAALVGSGAAMAYLHGGPAFVVLVPLHRWASYAIVPLILGHWLVAAGVLPGYRGVWRSMHLGGRLDAEVARRLWPGWAARAAPVTPGADPAGGDGAGRARGPHVGRPGAGDSRVEAGPGEETAVDG